MEVVVGSSKCHTRHTANGGVVCFNYVLGTNSNPLTTCASDGQVNLYPNIDYYCTMYCVLLEYYGAGMRNNRLYYNILQYRYIVTNILYWSVQQ